MRAPMVGSGARDGWRSRTVTAATVSRAASNATCTMRAGSTPFCTAMTPPAYQIRPSRPSTVVPGRSPMRRTARVARSMRKRPCDQSASTAVRPSGARAMPCGFRRRGSVITSQRRGVGCHRRSAAPSPSDTSTEPSGARARSPGRRVAPSSAAGSGITSSRAPSLARTCRSAGVTAVSAAPTGADCIAACGAVVHQSVRPSGATRTPKTAPTRGSRASRRSRTVRRAGSAAARTAATVRRRMLATYRTPRTESASMPSAKNVVSPIRASGWPRAIGAARMRSAAIASGGRDRLIVRTSRLSRSSTGESAMASSISTARASCTVSPARTAMRASADQ